MNSIDSPPFTVIESTPKMIRTIFFDPNPSQLAVLHSRFIQLPIPKDHSNQTQQYFSEETFPYIQKWSIQQFRCSKKLYPLILAQISHISFENLTFLHLSTCYIESIEAISWLNAPNLQQVSLDDNDISSIKPLQKTNFNKLQLLSCYSNFFLHDQMKVLSRMKLNDDKISHIKLSKTGKKKIPFIEGLFKIQAGQKVNASIGFTQFSSPHIFQQVKSKFPNSLTSMIEGEIWMPDQLDYIQKNSIQIESDQEELEYFPYLRS